MSFRLQALALLISVILLGCVLSARADDAPAAQPTARALAEAILGGDETARRHAAGWLATMGEAEIGAVVEWVFKLQRRSSPASGRVGVLVRATVDGNPEREVRVGFRRDVSAGGTDPTRELFRSVIDGPTWAITNAQGNAQVALPEGRYRLQVERAAATPLMTDAQELTILPQPLELRLGTGLIAARVVDRLGHACEGFTLDAWCQEATVRWIVDPIPIGSGALAMLRGLPAGRWTLRARGGGGYVSAEQVAHVSQGKEEVVQFRVGPHGLLLLEGTERVPVRQGEPEFVLMQGAVRSEFRLDAGRVMSLHLPVGAWVLYTNGQKEVLDVRDGETLRRPERRQPGG